MRQLLIDAFPDSSGKVILRGKDFRYLVQVLRLGPGSPLEIRLPDGTLASMSVLDIDRSSRTATLSLPVEPGLRKHDGFSSSNDRVSALNGGNSTAPGISMPPAPEVPAGFPEIILFQWILKGPKMDQVFRQATEAGVAIIVPVLGDRCLSLETGGVGQEKADRWERIVREARQQSGSPIPTRVHETTASSGVSAVWASLPRSGSSAALVLTEAPLARKSLHEYLGTRPGTVALAIGPEGGMSSREHDFLAAAGFDAVHFRTNILRAETAALYGIAAVQTLILESETWRPHE